MSFFRRSTQLVTALALSAAAIVPAHAQRIGIMAGATFSDIHGSDDVKLDNRTGTMVGVSLQLPANKTFVIQPELLFLNKGAKFGSSVNDGSGNQNNFSSVRLDYVEIPLLLRANLSQGLLVPHIYAGPSIGFNVNCSISGGSGNNDCTEQNFKPKTLDYGVTVGGGVDFNLGGIAATGGVRYGIGLADIRSDDSDAFRNRVHNGVLSIYLGVGLGSLGH